MFLLENHYIICGFGSFGKEIAYRFIESGEKIIVIEIDDAKIDFLQKEKIPVIRYDIRLSNALIDSGIDKAKGLITAVDNNDKNLAVYLNARKLNSEIYIVTRVDLDIYEDLAIKAGANEIIMPEKLAGFDVAKKIIEMEKKSL
jgi:voltage-gated potassium channel